MIDNTLGQQLHCRATTGQPLTETERAQLDAWYRALDAEEDAWLAQLPPVPSVAEVQEQIDKSLNEIAALSRNIRQVCRANEVLRREKEALYRQLMEQTSDTQKAV